jgi:hypothetical protein
MSKPKPSEELVRKSITLPKWLWEVVVAYRKEQAFVSEAEAVRRLLLRALTVEKKMK